MNETPNTPTLSNDTDNYPIQAQIPYPQQSSRLLALATIIFFAKVILLIPHLVITYFVALFAGIAAIAAQFFILVKGYYPQNLFALVKGLQVWQLRLNSFMLGLTDQYPPLAFDEADRAQALTAIKKVLVGIVAFIVVVIILILLANN